jgi:hypothetical protein
LADIVYPAESTTTRPLAGNDHTGPCRKPIDATAADSPIEEIRGCRRLYDAQKSGHALGTGGRDPVSTVVAHHPDLPVLYVSGLAKGLTDDVIEPGATIVSKPFTASTLLCAVRTLIDGMSAVDPVNRSAVNEIAT